MLKGEKRKNLFFQSSLCGPPLPVLTFHWEEVGLSCTLWHLWCSHILAWKWQEKQLSGCYFFASVHSFRLCLSSRFTGVTQFNYVNRGRDRDNAPCFTCSCGCESVCVCLRQEMIWTICNPTFIVHWETLTLILEQLNQSGLGPPVSNSEMCNLRFWPPGGNKIYYKHLPVTKIH